MSLPSLFIREAKQSDTSITKLPQDRDQWPETIVSLIREKLPQTKNTTVKISFSKENEELGTATGAAELYNQKLNKTVYIPLIVKSYALYPLDVMMLPMPGSEKNFDVVPLTKEYFDEALFNNEVFDKLDQPFDRISQLYGYAQGNLQLPPTPVGRNVYASAHIIDSITGDVWSADIDDFIAKIKSDPSILVGYEKRANLDILKKIVRIKEASAMPTVMLDNISLLKKDVGRGYSVISTSDEAYAPIVNAMSSGQLEELMRKADLNTEDTLHEVDRNGEYIVFNNLHPKDSTVHFPAEDVFSTLGGTPSEINRFGAYTVQAKNGVYYTGVVIPNIINYDMTVSPYKVFSSPNKSAFSDSILGTVAEDKIPIKMLNYVEPRVGMTGTFVTTNGKNAIATMPVTIRNIFVKNGDTYLTAMDLQGTGIKIKYVTWGCGNVATPCDHGTTPCNTFEEEGNLRKIVKIKDYYIVPGQFKFMPLENFSELSGSIESILLKSANANLDAQPIKVSHTGGSQFSLKGPDMQKMAAMINKDSNNLGAKEAVFILTAKGCGLKKVAQALKIAGELGVSTIHGLPKTIYGVDIVKENIKLASQWSTVVRTLKTDLIKEASQFEDSQIVDTALGLNFINPDNLEKFIGFIPNFENSIRMLAQTLLASRLGMTEISESAAATAMMKMVEVVKGLKRLALQLGGD